MATTRYAPPLRSEARRARQLVVTKRRAGALLVAVTVVFVVVTVVGAHATWAGYVQAGAEAAMVGGLADWFAVTALFRHPLGIPIPHTAIVVERKDQFAETLGEFIQESFLTPDALVERVREGRVVARLADWLADPGTGERLARDATDAIVAAVDLLRDDDVHTALERLLSERLDAVPLAPLTGRVLGFLTRDGRHDKVLDAALVGLEHFLDTHHDELRQRLGWQVPWWVPPSIEDRIYERLFGAARNALHDMAADPGHHLRRELDTRLVQLAVDLQTSPTMRERGEELKRELLGQPQLRDWVAALWTEAKERLRAHAADPDSELRRQLARTFTALGARLRDDPTVAAAAEDTIESAVRYVARHFDTEVSALVTGTIASWDAEETGRRLELLLGPDLQYIRINGTVVGGAAGLVLHAVAQALG